MTEVYVVFAIKDGQEAVGAFTDRSTAAKWYKRFKLASIHTVELDMAKDLIMLSEDIG